MGQIVRGGRGCSYNHPLPGSFLPLWRLVFLGELTRRRAPLKLGDGLARHINPAADVDRGEPTLPPPPPRRNWPHAERRKP